MIKYKVDLAGGDEKEILPRSVYPTLVIYDDSAVSSTYAVIILGRHVSFRVSYS